MIGSHIIPKFYLEQFSSPSRQGKDKPGRIWVYEKGREPDERATSVQGRENGYFGFVAPDGSLEESFETVLASHENACNDILAYAKFDTYPWPAGSREKLAYYTALLYSRATQSRAFSERNLQRITSELSAAANDESFIRELVDALSRKIGTAVPMETMRKSILLYVEETKTPGSAKNIFLSDLLENAKYNSEFLLKKQPWRILRPPEGTEFVTTDNPLIACAPLGNGLLHPGYGFGKLEVIALFPLAPDACLLMGETWDAPQTLDINSLNAVNEALVTICDRAPSKCRQLFSGMEDLFDTVRVLSYQLALNYQQHANFFDSILVLAVDKKTDSRGSDCHQHPQGSRAIVVRHAIQRSSVGRRVGRLSPASAAAHSVPVCLRLQVELRSRTSGKCHTKV